MNLPVMASNKISLKMVVSPVLIKAIKESVTITGFGFIVVYEKEK